MTILTRQGFIAAVLISTQSWLFCQQSTPRALPAASPPAEGQPYQELSRPGGARSNGALVDAPSASKTYRLGSGVGPSYEVPPVVVQFSNHGDAGEALRTDLEVVTALVRKAIEPGGDEETLASPDTLKRRSANGISARAIYVEGFGAIVFVKVNFPVLNGNGSGEAGPEPAAEAQFNRATQASPGPPYDAGQVENLKIQILGSLKEAKGFQSLSAGDFLSVVVFGPAAGTVRGTGVDAGQRRGTVLAMRVKKSDIDAFAAGTLDAAKFKEKAAIATYYGSGYDVTSVNSWTKNGSLFQVQPQGVGFSRQLRK